MKATEMLEQLREFHRDKAAMRNRHIASAQYVTDYDFNNTYQYMIAREDTHVRWLVDAITDLGGQPDENVAAPRVEPAGKAAQTQRSVIAADRDEAERFLEKWKPRIAPLPNARHRTMLRVMLGEVEEHRHFLDLALSGRSDLLGRRADGAGTGGGVLPTRWLGGNSRA